MLSLGISSAEKFWQPISRHTEKYFDLVININNTYKKITNWKTDKRGKNGKYQRQLQHCCSKLFSGQTGFAEGPPSLQLCLLSQAGYSGNRVHKFKSRVRTAAFIFNLNHDFLSNPVRFSFILLITLFKKSFLKLTMRGTTLNNSISADNHHLPNTEPVRAGISTSTLVLLGSWNPRLLWFGRTLQMI